MTDPAKPKRVPRPLKASSSDLDDDRVPPHDLAAEGSLLGAAMTSSDAAAVVGSMRVADFYKPTHQHIAQAICTLVAAEAPVDQVTVGDELTRNGLLDLIGGHSALAEMQNSNPATSAAAYYAGIIIDAAGRRRLVDIGELCYSARDLASAMVEVQRILDGLANPSRNGELLIEVVDWTVAPEDQLTEAIVDGLVLPGRWTAFVAGPKVGKSTLLLHLGHRVVRGLDPFHDAAQSKIGVLYLDGEMGEADVRERLEALGLNMVDLGLLYYSDKIPKGDTVQGGAAIVSVARALCVGVVVLDGINEFVTGAEKDDVPWRSLFENTVAPLKRAGIAVITSDNTGKDQSLSARGSSTKIDKPDAVIMLKRTNNGLNLTTTHRRSSSFRHSLDLAIAGVEGECPIDYRYTAASWPAGTDDAVRVLDALGVPVGAGRRTARKALKEADAGMSNEVLGAALRRRKTGPGQVVLDLAGPVSGPVDPK